MYAIIWSHNRTAGFVIPQYTIHNTDSITSQVTPHTNKSCPPLDPHTFWASSPSHLLFLLGYYYLLSKATYPTGQVTNPVIAPWRIGAWPVSNIGSYCNLHLHMSRGPYSHSPHEWPLLKIVERSLFASSAPYRTWRGALVVRVLCSADGVAFLFIGT